MESSPTVDTEGPTWRDASSWVACKRAREAGIDPELFPSYLTTFPHLHGEGEPVAGELCKPRPSDPPRPGGMACLPSKNSRCAPDAAPKKPGHIEITRGAGVVKVQRPHEQHARQPPQRENGDIVGFSRSSARRLQVRMARCRADHTPVFSTLTYPDVYAWTGDRIKNQIKKLWERLNREFAGIAMVWKLEIKRRKSGALSEGWKDENGETKGVQMPHIHLLIWKDTGGEWTESEYIEIREWLAENWHDIVFSDVDADALKAIQDAVRGEGGGDVVKDHKLAGTSTERIRSRRGTLFYVSEYMAKAEESLQFSIGRYWGIYGRKNMPWGETISVPLNHSVACQMMRAVMKAEGIEYDGLPLTRTHLCNTSRPWGRWILNLISQDRGIPPGRAEQWGEYIGTGGKSGNTPREDMERGFSKWFRKHMN